MSHTPSTRSRPSSSASATAAAASPIAAAATVTTTNEPPTVSSLRTPTRVTTGSTLPPYTPGPEPPALPYSIKQHKISITIIWSLLALDSFILPIALFYPLWYATKLRQAIIFAITTSVFGFISGIEWAFRSWQLMSKPHVRPLGVTGPEEVDLPPWKYGTGWWRARRYYFGFDFFHFTYSTGYMFALAELIVGAAPHHPFVRVCAAPSPTFITIFGLVIITLTLAHHLRLTFPFRISSTPARGPVMPATFTILEDVLSVDTLSGQDYRHALALRYEKSPRFRRLLKQMDIFWGVPALLLGVGLLATIGHPKVEQTKAYGLGWALPPVWAMVWAVITTAWVKWSLSREKKKWRREWELDSEKKAGGVGVAGEDGIQANGTVAEDQKDD